MAEDVTAISTNTYSNRAAVANDDAPGGNQALRESRFWYHAEFIDNIRLQELLRTVRAPDLLKTLDTLRNAALLNDYFFFPAHEEALGAGCSNVEATEFGAYAGEWACMSVVLARDETETDPARSPARHSSGPSIWVSADAGWTQPTRSQPPRLPPTTTQRSGSS